MNKGVKNKIRIKIKINNILGAKKTFKQPNNLQNNASQSQSGFKISISGKNNWNDVDFWHI